jgi:hypothetical protein
MTSSSKARRRIAPVFSRYSNDGRGRPIDDDSARGQAIAGALAASWHRNCESSGTAHGAPKERK